MAQDWQPTWMKEVRIESGECYFSWPVTLLT